MRNIFVNKKPKFHNARSMANSVINNVSNRPVKLQWVTKDAYG